jgi:hypothetical protein
MEDVIAGGTRSASSQSKQGEAHDDIIERMCWQLLCVNSLPLSLYHLLTTIMGFTIQLWQKLNLNGSASKERR